MAVRRSLNFYILRMFFQPLLTDILKWNFFYICRMLKKNLILCLLLFFYSIVLAHNAIPHGHFDELFSSEHESDAHDHNDQSNHDHHFLFSHSISLHVTIEKQIAFSSIQTKATSKSLSNGAAYCLLPDKQVLTPPDLFWTFVHSQSELSAQPFCCNSWNRGPPPSV